MDLYRGWNAYVDGMGDLTGELFIGLIKMRRLTGDNPFTIRFDLEAPDGEKRYAEYAGNTLGKASTKYTINVGTYSGKRQSQRWRGAGAGEVYGETSGWLAALISL